VVDLRWVDAVGVGDLTLTEIDFWIERAVARKLLKRK